MKKLLTILVLLLGLLLAPAFAQTAGQLQPGHVWGNGTAAQAPAQDTTPSKIFDQYFTCTTQGSLLDRGASLWGCLPPSNNSLLVTNGSGVPAWGTSLNNTLTLQGTSAPASASGNTIIGGTFAAAPALANTGQAFLYNEASAGLVLEGDGSSNDITILNKNGATVLNIPTGTANLIVSGATSITSNSANALVVGPNGTTNPVLAVNGSNASAATGIKISGAAAGSNAFIDTISSGTNENLAINAKGSGTVVLGNTSTGGVDLGNGGTGVTVHNAFTATGLVTYADMAGAALATSSQYIAGTSSVLVPASVAYTAETTTTYGATTTFNFSTFINTSVTLTGNITTMNVSNVKAGQAGQIRFIQDATGSRTTVWNSVFKFAGGVTPTLSSGAGDVDVLFYSCVSSSLCYASLSQNMK